MAIKQIVPIVITLQGDGVAQSFTFALAHLYQAGQGGSIPFGTTGVVPSSVSINNPPIEVASSTVDANGNLTLTFTAVPDSGVQYSFEVDLTYDSGAATSTSPTQAMNVNITGGSIAVSEAFSSATGSAVPAQAAYIAGKNAGNLVGIAVDASGNVGVNVVGSVAVTGTFWQATQPVSGSVSVSNFPASQAVTGTFWQATQPVSGSVSVSNFPSTQAVTGTFWQATQPVSLASLPSLPTGSNTIGAVAQASGPWTQNLTQVGSSAVSLGSKTSANSIPVVIASDQAAIPVSGNLTVTGAGTLFTVLGLQVASGFWQASNAGGGLVQIPDLSRIDIPFTINPAGTVANTFTLAGISVGGTSTAVLGGLSWSEDR